MSAIRKILHHGKDILVVDYSDLNEIKMIEVLGELKQALLNENQKVLVLNIFNDKGFLTPGFMRSAEKEFGMVSHLIAKQAMVGLSETKKMILKGFNARFNKNIKNFNTINEALTFLADEGTSDRAEKDL
jgi:hypothetical protein